MKTHLLTYDPNEWIYATGSKEYEVETAQADIHIEVSADAHVVLYLEYEDPYTIIPVQSGSRINFKGRTLTDCKVRLVTPHKDAKIAYKALFGDLNDDIRSENGYEPRVLHEPRPPEIIADERARNVIHNRLLASGMPEEAISDILAGVDPNSSETDFEFDDELDDMSELTMFQLEEELRHEHLLEQIEERQKAQKKARPKPKNSEESADPDNSDTTEKSGEDKPD